MKIRILSSLFAIVLSVSAHAQLSYGVEAGLNVSDYSIVIPGYFSPTAVAVPGIAAGGIIEYGVSDHFYVQPGAFFAINGIKYSYDLPFFGDFSFSAHINTIQIPINLIYKLNEPGGNRFYFGAGPFLGVNLGGSARATATNSSFLGGTGLPSDSTSTLTVGSGPKDYVKRLDLGIGVNAGYELAKGFIFRAQVKKGLINMASEGSGANAIKSMNYGISVAYLFGKHPTKKQPETKKTIKKSK